jgi:hypothetical protein
VDFGASSDTATLTFDQAGKNAASVWPRLCNVRYTSGGPTAGTSSQETMATLGVHISSITASDCVLTRHSSGTNADVRVYVEVWFYDGPSAGSHEFIVRWSGTKAVTNGNQTATQSISSVSDAGDLVASSLGVVADSPHPPAHFVRLSLSGTTTLTFTRENTTGDITAAALVVEMTGSAWQVEEVTHNFGAWNTTESETIATITSWATAFVISTMWAPDDENNETGYIVWAGSSATTVRFRQDSSSGTGNLSIATAFVVRNASMAVGHYDTVTGGASTFGTTTSPGAQTAAVTAIPDLNYAALVMHGVWDDSSFDGRPDGFFNYRMTDVDEIEIWRSRGNLGTIKWSAQVINFAGMTFGQGATGAPSGLFFLNFGR